MGAYVYVLCGDGAGREGGEQRLLFSACVRVGPRIGLPCTLAAQGGGEGGTAALSSGGPGIAAL